jgi:hypothetical protein
MQYFESGAMRSVDADEVMRKTSDILLNVDTLESCIWDSWDEMVEDVTKFLSTHPEIHFMSIRSIEVKVEGELEKFWPVIVVDKEIARRLHDSVGDPRYEMYQKGHSLSVQFTIG